MNQGELFGVQIAKPVKNRVSGYVATPGTGPAGETCGSCKHMYKRTYAASSYLKCQLVQVTHGPGSDIRAKSPACSQWISK